MKAKIYIGAKKYALYIGRKIVEKTLEFLTLPARFVSNKVQDLKNLTMWGNSHQDGSNYNFTLDKSYLTLNEHINVTEPYDFGNNGGRISYHKDIDVSQCNSVTVNFTTSLESNFFFMYATLSDINTPITRVIAKESGYIIDTSNAEILRLAFYSGNERFNSIDELTSLEVTGNVTSPTPNTPIEVESVGDRTKNLFNLDDLINAYPTCFEFDKRTGYIKLINWKTDLYSTGITVDWKAGSTISLTPISTGTNMSTNARIRLVSSTGASQTFFITDANGNINPPQKITVTQNIVKMMFDHTKYNADTWGIENFMVSEEDIPFEPYGYKAPVTVSGKNLFDRTLPNEIEGGYMEYPLSLETGKTYTLSLEKNNCYNDGSPYSKQYVFTINKPDLTSNWTQMVLAYFGNTNGGQRSNTYTFTIPNEGASMYVYWGGSTTKPNDYLEILDTFFGNMQIELGDTATEYTPYIEPTTANIYLPEPLRKIGEYSDYIDLESQKIVRNIGEINPTSYNKEMFDSHYRFSTRISNKKLPASVQDRLLVLSDKYVADLTPTAYSETRSQYAITGYTGVNTVYIYDKDLDNTQSKTTDINCSIYYIQDTLTEETIDIPAINIPQGDLTLNIDTIVKPSKIEITGDIDNVD